MWNDDNDNDDGSYLMSINYQKLCYVLSTHYLRGSSTWVCKGQAPEIDWRESICKCFRTKPVTYIKHSLSISRRRKYQRVSDILFNCLNYANTQLFSSTLIPSTFSWVTPIPPSRVSLTISSSAKFTLETPHTSPDATAYSTRPQ